MDTLLDYFHVLASLLLPSTILGPITSSITTTAALLRTLQTHLTPLLTRLITKPDVASVLLLLGVLLISFKILDMAYRAVMFWVRLVVQIVLWGGLMLLMTYIWGRGVDGVVDDMTGLVAYWSGEYQRFQGDVEREVQKNRGMKNQKSGAAGWGNGYGPYGAAGTGWW